MEGGPSIQDRESQYEIVYNSQENLVEDEEEIKGCFNWFCHPKGKAHRFIALIFMCFLGFGSYFCYDNPAALEDHFKHDLNLDTFQFTMLYSMYSWPNVFLCFVGGYLQDRIFGIRLGTIIYMGLTLVGQLIFTVGIYFDVYWCMLAGRFVFGIGAESLAVSQNSYAVLWFKGKELNMVFGLQLSFARIGSTVNFQIMESIYQAVFKTMSGPKGLGTVILIASVTCLLSMFCALVLGMLDKRAARITQRNESASGDVVKLQDIAKFSASFWLVTGICVLYYVAIFPFIALAKEFFMTQFNMNGPEANSVASLVYLISGFASPVLGLIIDKTGKNVYWIIVAILTTIMAHLFLTFTHITPYVAMVIMGFSYSTLASSLWPLVSLMIPEYQLGTAYGVCQSVQNLGLAVAPIITGKIVDSGYKILEGFFLASLFLALLTTLSLWVLNRKRNGNLNMTPAARLRYQQELQAAEDRQTPDETLTGSTDNLVDNAEENTR